MGGSEEILSFWNILELDFSPKHTKSGFYSLSKFQNIPNLPNIPILGNTSEPVVKKLRAHHWL